ncbi:protein 5NUC-like [Contarinia nasturtii]|uniref:protein 5NUC-like n=1 Tax=Contarinia nasturtii TaxID=265458 RepID=UPI0012D3EBDC|nr:protein 5NUC-like [Contarinia nasturtii]XP_031627630.1 protein 5NUC-like [Contarinia nasturtii]
MLDTFVRKSYLALSIFALLLMFSIDFVRAVNNYLDLTILHSNDMHSKFAAWDGFGGFARTSHVIKEHRRAAKNGGPPVLYLNAGDVYTGSRWFNLFKDEVVTDFMNALKPDAMCLGNHEFDFGLDPLVPFLEHANFSIVFTNLKNKADHPLRKHTIPSVVFKIKKFKIGVIGYLTPSTARWVPNCAVDFRPEVEAINEEANKLRKKGVKTIIGLSHSGFVDDLKIAESCPLLDLVIGGHTHTFLYTGQQPDKEVAASPYPTIVKQKTGKQVPIVQAYMSAKYLGKLEIRISKNGNITMWNGNPILMDAKIPQDPAFLALENKYRKKEANGPKPIAESKLDFCSYRCVFWECGIGNMMTDAFIKAAKTKLNDASFASSVALITSRNIRGRLSSGYLDIADLSGLVKFPSELVIVKISGEQLMAALEHSVGKYPGNFLQMSGLRVVFDVASEQGSRVVSAEVRNSNSTYDKLDLKTEYNVIITKHLFEKGNGYTMFSDCQAKFLSISIFDAFKSYIEEMQVINPEPVHEGRITVRNPPPLPLGAPPLYAHY